MNQTNTETIKEAKRLEQEPFKTMVEPDAEVLNDLRGWKPPRGTAYVLYESRHYFLRQERWGKGLFTFNVEARPEQVEKHYYFTRKGYKVLHYGNFPKANDENPERAQKAVMYSGKDKINPWTQLENILKSSINGEVEKNREVKELQRKVQEYEAKMNKSKVKPTED